LIGAVRDGKRVGNAVWASSGRREAEHARRVHAKIMGVTLQHGLCSMLFLHLRRIFSDSNRPKPRDISSCRKIRHMDDSAAVCVRGEFSGGQVPADAEQGHCHRCDIRGGHGGAPALELVTDYEGGVGSGGCGGGAKWVVVVHSGGSVGVCA